MNNTLLINERIERPPKRSHNEHETLISGVGTSPLEKFNSPPRKKRKHQTCKQVLNTLKLKLEIWWKSKMLYIGEVDPSKKKVLELLEQDIYDLLREALEMDENAVGTWLAGPFPNLIKKHSVYEEDFVIKKMRRIAMMCCMSMSVSCMHIVA